MVAWGSPKPLVQVRILASLQKTYSLTLVFQSARVFPIKDNGQVIKAASEVVGAHVEAKVGQTTRAFGLCAIRIAANAEHPDPTVLPNLFQEATKAQAEMNSWLDW